VGRRATNSRRALGNDPLDAVIPGSAESSVESEREQQSANVSQPAATRSSRSAPAGVRKTRATFHLPIDLLEEARDVVYWVPGLTMANLTEEALRREIQRIKDVRNDGQDFPTRESDLKRGRPVT
jgi:hypothetical protein